MTDFPFPPAQKKQNIVLREKKTYHMALCLGALGEESALRLPERLGETAWFVQGVTESKELPAEVMSLFPSTSTMPTYLCLDNVENLVSSRSLPFVPTTGSHAPQESTIRLLLFSAGPSRSGR